MLKGLVDGGNIFLGEVLNITIDVLDNGGGVNGGEINSDNSIIAAINEDLSEVMAGID